MNLSYSKWKFRQFRNRSGPIQDNDDLEVRLSLKLPQTRA